VREGPNPELPAPAVFLCGDDLQAKATVAGMARSLGYDPVDVGKLAVARYVEPLCGLMVELDDPELVISVARPRPA
jgi:predicted dinucleotide-binding enzyme